MFSGLDTTQSLRYYRDMWLAQRIENESLRAQLGLQSISDKEINEVADLRTEKFRAEEAARVLGLECAKLKNEIEQLKGPAQCWADHCEEHFSPLEKENAILKLELKERWPMSQVRLAIGAYMDKEMRLREALMYVDRQEGLRQQVHDYIRAVLERDD